MGRSVVFQGITLYTPDAYSDLDLDALLTPSSSGTGIVALVGEADGGAPGINLIPGGSSATVVQKLLNSGPGADCTMLALQSGVDELVQNGASTVLFVKTNNSTQATAGIGTTVALTLTSRQYGLFTNMYTTYVTSVGGGAVLTVQQNAPSASSITENSPVVGVNQYFTLNYTGTGTAATFTFHYVSSVLTFATTLTGQTGGELPITIAVTPTLTVQQLVTMINNYTGYDALVVGGNAQVLVSSLDLVTTATSILNLMTPYGFVASIYELINWAATASQLVTITRAAGDAGAKVPTPFPATGAVPFTGGTRGTSTNSSVQAAFDLLLPLRVNIVLPLFSVDDQDGSTITIESVNSILADHVESRSSILGRSEAQGYVSIHGNLTTFLNECSRLSSMFVAVTSQNITALNVLGTLVQFPEYGFATVCAQTEAGSPIGTPLENRQIPVSGLTQDASWNPVVDSDQLIQGGALFAWLDPTTNLPTIKGGYTCWLGDDNNGRIFIETVESLIIFAFNHRAFMRQKFLGKSAFTTGDILSAIKQSETDERNTTKSIKDFDPSLTILFSTGNGVLSYQVGIIPWQGIRFILPIIVATQAVAS